MRTRNAALIVSSNIILQMVLIISGLILPRYIITTYGSEINGLVTSIKQSLLYFGFVSSGIGVASMAALYAPLAKKDIEKINAIASATNIFFRKAGYIFSAIMIVFLVIYPIFIVSGISRFVIIIMIFILSGEFLIEYFLLSKYRIYLNAAQKAYIILFSQALGVVVYTIVAVILIKIHMNILIVQIVATICYLLRALIIIVYTKKQYKYLNFNKKPDFASISNRWEAFLYKISDMVIKYTPVVIIVVLLGLKNVSVYSVYNMIFVSLGMLISVLSAGIVAIFGDIIVQKNMKKLNKCFQTYEMICAIIIFFLYTCTLKLIMPFISIYTQGITDAVYKIPAIGYLFVFSGVFWYIRMPFVTLVDANGNFKKNSIYSMAEAGLTLLLSIPLCLFYGIPGILLGTIIAGSIRSIFYIVYVYKYILKTNMIRSFIRICFNFIFMLLVYIIPFKFETESILSWFVLFGKVLPITFIIVVAGNCIIDFSSTKDLFLRIKHLISRQKDLAEVEK